MTRMKKWKRKRQLLKAMHVACVCIQRADLSKAKHLKGGYKHDN